MKCPACATDLQVTDRQGVEIDYCPRCRGVWLDRGELDKVIERAAVGNGPPRTHVPSSDSYPPYAKRHDDDFDDDWDDRGRAGGRRRKGWLGELFDFG